MKNIGKIGEDKVIDFLTAKGYKIIENNWRFKKLEIDIIAEKDDLIVVVEVKTRNYKHIIDPIESINKKKQSNIIDATTQYILENEIDSEVRFDVAIVIENAKGDFGIEHIKDAFNTLNII